MRELGKRDEVIGCIKRALDMLELAGADKGFLHARMNYELATLCPTPAEADELLRRSLTEFRNYFSGAKKSSGERAAYAGSLRNVALRFADRSPEEAEKLLDESITLWAEMCDESSSGRAVAYGLVQSILAQARHQRLAAGRAGDKERALAAARLAKAESLIQAAIARQRQTVSRFVFPEDRSILAQILCEESEYLFRQPGKAGTPGGLPAGTEGPKPEDDAGRRLRAEALLMEAIQIGRQLVAEFPKDSAHGDRLAAMLRIQAEHFGPKDGAKPPKGPSSPTPDP